MVAMVSNSTSFPDWSRERPKRLSEEGQMSLLVTALFCSIAPATQKGTTEYGPLTSADWSILWTWISFLLHLCCKSVGYFVLTGFNPCFQSTFKWLWSWNLHSPHQTSVSCLDILFLVFLTQGHTKNRSMRSWDYSCVHKFSQNP